ncbi:hypothetical protein B296_00050673 [Ensete ventricosum]|uniref:Uncharacterized protein n=1 Tax=Ensete ventricosum TaxID=4639 RepID=A0A426X1I1_ENSVE|nr:hypothetical protein B296_00050673 [Ensete ventricosum]
MWARVKFGATGWGSDDAVGTHRETHRILAEGIGSLSGVRRELAEGIGSLSGVRRKHAEGIGSLLGVRGEFIRRRPRGSPEDHRGLSKSLLGVRRVLMDLMVT